MLAPVLAGAAGLAMLTLVYLLDKLDVGPEFVFDVALLVLLSLGPDHLPRRAPARAARPLRDRRPAGRPAEPAEPGALRDALARALRDPTLELAYWVPEYEAYVGIDGEPVELPAEDSGRVADLRRARRHARSPR